MMSGLRPHCAKCTPDVAMFYPATQKGSVYHFQPYVRSIHVMDGMYRERNSMVEHIDLMIDEEDTPHEVCKLSIWRHKNQPLMDNIAKLLNLQSLHVLYSKLRRVPVEVTTLTQLVVLDLQGNDIQTLPDEMRHMRLLERVCINENYITELPGPLEHCLRLQSLNAWNNHIMTITRAIGKLTALTALNVRMNCIASLPEEMNKLDRLETLDIQNNQITEFKVKPGCLRALQTLHADFVCIDAILAHENKFNTRVDGALIDVTRMRAAIKKRGRVSINGKMFYKPRAKKTTVEAGGC